jgi:hypothetical protein
MSAAPIVCTACGTPKERGNFCKKCGASLVSQQLAKHNIPNCKHCGKPVDGNSEKVINAGTEYHRSCWDVIQGDQQVKRKLTRLMIAMLTLTTYRR